MLLAPVTVNVTVPVGVAVDVGRWATCAVNVTGAPVCAPADSVIDVVVVFTAADAGFANSARPASAIATPAARRTGAINLLAILVASVVPETAASTAAFPQ